MTDENANTSDLTTDEKLDQVLRKLGDLDARLAALEAAAADRVRETRPKLDLIIAELADLRDGQKDAAKRLDRIEAQLQSVDGRCVERPRRVSAGWRIGWATWSDVRIDRRSEPGREGGGSEFARVVTES